jgi:hypothetical protein
MQPAEAHHIIEQLKQGQRLLISDDGEESFRLLSISFRKDRTFNHNLQEGLLYDVVAPTRYTDRVVGEAELIELLCDCDYQQTLQNLRTP